MRTSVVDALKLGESRRDQRINTITKIIVRRERLHLFTGIGIDASVLRL